MFQAFVDDSGRGDPTVFVLAGYIAPPEIWTEFSREWQRRLDHARMPHFKMRDMARSPELLETAGWFYRAIEEGDISAAVSCIIRTDQLVEVVRSFPWPSFMRDTERLENPYYFAFKAITVGLVQDQANMGIGEPIDFIFDESGERAIVQEAWDLQKISATPDVRRLMGGPPTFCDDRAVKQLQAADLYAWWVLKWHRDGSANEGVKQLKFAWPPKKDIPRLHIEFSEADLRAELEKGLAPEALAIARLANPSSALRSLEKRERGVKMTLPDPSSPWRGDSE